MSAPFTFSTHDGGKTYTRQAHGFESLCGSFASELQGLFFYTSSVSVRLPAAPAADQLKTAIEASWIDSRYQCSQIGCTVAQNKQSREWTYKYDVLTSQSELAAWAQTTIKWHDEEKTMLEHQVDLDGVYWDPAAGAPGICLHVLPIDKVEGKWMLSTLSNHGFSDARGTTFLFDHLLTTLKRILLPTTSVVANYHWGKESTRLVSAAAILTGEFEAYAATPPVLPGPPPPGLIPFFPPIIKNTSVSSKLSLRKMTLSASETAKFRAVCRLHGRTVSQVVDAVIAVANIEASLRTAPLHGDEHAKVVADLYEQATHWIVVMNFKDQRPSFPQHSKFDGPEGSVLFGTDAWDLAFDMGKIRKTVLLDKDTGSVKRDSGKEAFWDGLVPSCIEAVQRNATDHKNHIIRDINRHATVGHIAIVPLNIRAGVLSSVGHIEGLGAFADFTPSAGNSVIVEEIFHHARANIPLMKVIYWQYSGEMVFALSTGGEYETDKDMDIMVDSLKGWLLDLIA